MLIPQQNNKLFQILRNFVPIVAVFSILFAIFYFFQNHAPDGDNALLNSNAIYFLLINLNIILVMLLAYLVTKNIVRLFLDRKRNIFGWKLRSRLVVAFVGLSLIPTVLLFLISKGILETVMQGWFAPQIVSSVDGAKHISKFYYDEQQDQIFSFTRQIAKRIAEIYPKLYDKEKPQKIEQPQLDFFESFLEEKRKEYGIASINIFFKEQNLIGSKKESKNLIFNKEFLAQTQGGKAFSKHEYFLNEDLVRAYIPIKTEDSSTELYYLVATKFIPKEITEVLSSVVDAYDEYNELRTYRRPLASSYILTLVIVTLMIIFTAIWVGFYLAKNLSGPIQLLAQGTEQVAHGNLDYRIPETGDDEIAIVVRSFNTMTKDLKQLTGELITRRQYMETVLANLAVGVISISPNATITTFNPSAAAIIGLHLKDYNEIDGKKIYEALPSTLSEMIRSMYQELQNSENKNNLQNITLTVSGESRHLQVLMSRLIVENNYDLGAVIILDDISDLVNAQRMAAWREVARRIAHEIKNPLTPIQLSAQRMQRRLIGGEAKSNLSKEDELLVSESTETIVKQVENLRRLVNEFSRFARMPRAIKHPEDLNYIINEVLKIFVQAHQEINFVLDLDSHIPILSLDKEQISRVIINLLDNAIFAVNLYQTDNSIQKVGFKPEIVVSSRFDRELELVSMSIGDNGVGIPDSDKPRLFEPYFSTKTGGSGLGLAIINTIVSDHNGFIRVRDQLPHGACFVVELPYEKKTFLPQK